MSKDKCTCAGNPSILCGFCIIQMEKQKRRKLEPSERMEDERRELMRELGHGRVFER